MTVTSSKGLSTVMQHTGLNCNTLQYTLKHIKGSVDSDAKTWIHTETLCTQAQTHMHARVCVCMCMSEWMQGCCHLAWLIRWNYPFCVPVCVRLLVCICVHVCLCACVRVCACVHVHVCEWVQVCCRLGWLIRWSCPFSFRRHFDKKKSSWTAVYVVWRYSKCVYMCVSIYVCAECGALSRFGDVSTRKIVGSWTFLRHSRHAM